MFRVLLDFTALRIFSAASATAVTVAVLPSSSAIPAITPTAQLVTHSTTILLWHLLVSFPTLTALLAKCLSFILRQLLPVIAHLLAHFTTLIGGHPLPLGMLDDWRGRKLSVRYSVEAAKGSTDHQHRRKLTQKFH